MTTVSRVRGVRLKIACRTTGVTKFTSGLTSTTTLSRSRSDAVRNVTCALVGLVAVATRLVGGAGAVVSMPPGGRSHAYTMMVSVRTLSATSIRMLSVCNVSEPGPPTNERVSTTASNEPVIAGKLKPVATNEESVGYRRFEFTRTVSPAKRLTATRTGRTLGEGTMRSSTAPRFGTGNRCGSRTMNRAYRVTVESKGETTKNFAD